MEVSDRFQGLTFSTTLPMLIEDKAICCDLFVSSGKTHALDSFPVAV